jgi:membrane protease YdiL (CAAX protease family)
VEESPSTNKLKITKENKNHSRWSAKSALGVGVLSYVVAQLFIAIALIAIALLQGESALENDFLNQPWVSLFLTGIGALGLIVVLLVYLRRKKLTFKQLGLGKLSDGQLWRIPLAFGAYLLAVIIVIGLVTAFVPGFDVEQEQEIGFTGAAGWQLILAFIGLVVIPPFAEELLFRGFIYQGLRDGWVDKTVLVFGLAISLLLGLSAGVVAALAFAAGTIISVLIAHKKSIYGAAFFTSMLFGLVHMQWNVAIDTFILSFALIWLYQKSGSIWGSILLHALKNGIAFVLLFELVTLPGV